MEEQARYPHQPVENPPNYNSFDVDDQQIRRGNDKGSIQDDPDVRMGFIRKVYGILCAQLCITAFAVCVPLSAPATLAFMRANYWIAIMMMVLSVAVSCALICVRTLAVSVPINYVLLSTFTVAEAYLVSFIASMYDP